MRGRARRVRLVRCVIAGACLSEIALQQQCTIPVHQYYSVNITEVCHLAHAKACDSRISRRWRGLPLTSD